MRRTDARDTFAKQFQGPAKLVSLVVSQVGVKKIAIAIAPVPKGVNAPVGQLNEFINCLVFMFSV